MKELKKLKLLVSNEKSDGRCDGAVRGNPMSTGVSAVLLFCLSFFIPEESAG